MRDLSVLAVLAVLCVPAAAQIPEPAAKIDEIFAEWKSQESPGCTVAVSESGKTLLSRAYGMADLEHDVPITPATIFEAGSVSKQFTATAAFLLVQQGKLSLTDDVRKYVPELPDYGKPITIDHLIHHTSGLRDWGAIGGVNGWPRGTRIHTHAHMLDVASRQKALNYETGAEFSYTNTGYNLLAVIVGRVSGQSFADFTRVANGSKLDFVPNGLRVLTPDGNVIPFDRVTEVSPTAAQLAEYVGDYTSDEAEVTWKVAMEEGKLVIKWRPDTVVALKPLYADAFHTENGFLIRFFRKEGKISELSVGLTRVRDLRFARR